MNLNAIKLNPSQTLRLVKERDMFFSKNFATGKAKAFETSEVANDKDFENVALNKQKIFFTTPLICAVEENFSREDFLSINKFSIYRIQKFVENYFFPCKIEFACNKGAFAAHEEMISVFLCALEFDEKKEFGLEEFFFGAREIVQNADENSWQEENFLFAATSFKFFRAEIDGNSWRFYDEVWKKV